MTFAEVLDQICELLQREQRLSYRGLKRRFDLDDEYLADLKEELIGAKRLAIDEDGRFLVWVGAAPVLSSKFRVLSSEDEGRNPVVSNTPPLSQDSALKTQHSTAERRQLTVMFCDLVGSTALSEQLDPEELRDVVQTYQETCTAVIQHYDGYIAQHLGDGLLVYFGYPAAHEDEAARAVRAGLEIIKALHQQVPSPSKGEGQGEDGNLIPLQNTPHPSPPPQGARGFLESVPTEARGLQVRIGIHTGLVVIGAIGSSTKREMLALGETPNLAARLQGLAEPDTVVISAATQRLVPGLFEYQELGAQLLKGLSTPVSVYRVVRERTAQSRFSAAIHQRLTPLVGRAEELGLLQQRWEHAKQGAGQVVLLSGEPGIGKSRLVQALKEQVETEKAMCSEFHCSPYHQNSAFYPIIDCLQRFLQFAHDDAPEEKLKKLEAIHVGAMHESPLQSDAIPLFAALLSLPHPEGSPPITGSPQKQKEKMQAALVAWLIGEAEQRAICSVWEDLHWADPSTLEVLTLLLDQVPTTRMLTLLTSRPEFSSPWGSRSYLAQLTLNRLGRNQVETIIERVTGDKTLPPEVVQQIVAKTDGVPLFVEELTKSVVESVEAIHESLLHLGIPTTLQDALMARLDRLGSAKEIAQLGATIGREFSYDLLHIVANQDESNLQQSLRQLIEVELLYQRGLPPQATYLFKHALIQDTAYQSLLKSRRQQLHRQIAQVLTNRFPETLETQPELLAHHYTEAGLVGQAITYWQKAGQKASQRSAHVEAISHLTKGLELLKTLPDTPERAQQELSLQVALGAPLTATKGTAAREVGKAYARARELCQQLGETPQLFPVLRGLWLFYIARAEHQTARELAEQCLRLAQSARDPALLLEAQYMLGNTLFYFGEFAPAREHFEQSMALHNFGQHHPHAFLYGQDTGVVCLARAAWVLWFLGYPDQALKLSYQAITLAQELSHPHSLAYARGSAATFHQLRREEQTAQEQAEAAMTLSTEQGFPIWVAWGTMLRGWVLAKQGRGEEGISQIRQGIAAFRATGAEVSRDYLPALLAEAYEKAGQVEEGLSSLAEALAAVDNSGERWYEAELYRLKGELTLQQENQKAKGKGQKSKMETEARATRPDDQSEAEACFLKAIEVAQRQQAKSLELRATMSLVRLWQQQGKTAEAHDLLAPVYHWFIEGFDTKDLQEAKALLEELA